MKTAWNVCLTFVVLLTLGACDPAAEERFARTFHYSYSVISPPSGSSLVVGSPISIELEAKDLYDISQGELELTISTWSSDPKIDGDLLATDVEVIDGSDVRLKTSRYIVVDFERSGERFRLHLELTPRQVGPLNLSLSASKGDGVNDRDHLKAFYQITDSPE